ncbi:MAG: PspC domain-containing protein [Clostridia bacterium]|nr:PspC domain-containing protein [Clostridia bacterium]
MSRRLERTRHDNVLAGVCGGIAKYFNIDVTIVRAIWVVSAFFGGPSFGTYIICALIIPKEKMTDSYYNESDEDEKEKEERSKAYLGIGLIAIGAIMILKMFVPILSFKFFWPALLIGGGLMLLGRKSNQEDDYE